MNISSGICSVRNGELYSAFLQYFPSPLALPTESDYHGLDEGTFLSAHFSTTEFRLAGQIHLGVASHTNRCLQAILESIRPSRLSVTKRNKKKNKD